MTERPTLLALRALGLGDLLTAIPALRALDRAFPDHHRLLAAPAPLAALSGMAGIGFEVVDTGGLGSLRGVSRRPQVAVNLHGRGPQSHLMLLDLAPGRLIAFSNRKVPADGPAWRDREHEMRRWCRLLTESGITADAGDHRIDPAAVPPGTSAGAVVLHPGAKDAARRWPPARWAEVARWLASVGTPPVITGTEGEKATALLIARSSGLPPSAVRAGRTTLAELTSLVATARLVVCGDTGVAHLATAFGTPSVVLFGPTPPAEWGPPPTGPHTVLWAGRRGDPRASVPDGGLLEITVPMVLEATALRLGPTGTGPAAAMRRPSGRARALGA